MVELQVLQAGREKWIDALMLELPRDQPPDVARVLDALAHLSHKCRCYFLVLPLLLSRKLAFFLSLANLDLPQL